MDDIALSGQVNALAVDTTGDLYVLGAFTNADGNASADGIFRWTGTAVIALDSGAQNVAKYSMALAPDGKIYIGGGFTSPGGVKAEGVAVWDGATWHAIDALLPNATAAYSIGIGPADSVIRNNYDVYCGFNESTTAQYAGTTTITNGGTVPAVPYIVVERSGGTAATLVSLRNHTTGQELWFDYDLFDGEEVTLDFRPGYNVAISDYFGTRFDMVLPGSEVGSFALNPGSNQITMYVDEDTSPTITAYMIWRDAYDGIDD